MIDPDVFDRAEAGQVDDVEAVSRFDKTLVVVALVLAGAGAIAALVFAAREPGEWAFPLFAAVVLSLLGLVVYQRAKPGHQPRN